MAGILFEGDDISDEQRAAHARALAKKNKVAAGKRAAEAKARVGERKIVEAQFVNGKVLEDRIVEPGEYYTCKIGAGNHLRIIDLEGRQAVDFLCYDLNDFENRYNAANTIKFNKNIYIKKETKLYSDRGNILMIIDKDTVGWHDTIGGCCSAEANYLRYGIRNTPNCRQNFIDALGEYGLGPRDIPANLNFFMYVPVSEDGSTEIVEGKSEPGDFVDLVAERDVLVVISNCPQVYNPCNDWNPTPVRLIAWKADNRE